MVRNRTILVIEQETSIAEGLKSILGKEGYSVVSAYTSRHLKEIFKENIPDLAIININLPKEFGLKILRKTKELFPKIPVIAMSVNSNSLSANELKRLGASEFITKPFDVEGLKSKIGQLLKR
jgi:two-component system NtrC family response regulator